MSEYRGAEVYQQRFTSTEPVTVALNQLLESPQDEFIFYAKKEFLPDEVLRDPDETSNTHARRIATKIIDLRNNSLRLGNASLQLASPVDAIVHELEGEDAKQLELDFSAFAPGAYWKIMQEFHRDEYPFTPPTNVLREISSRSLAVYLSFDALKQPEEFNEGKARLLQALRDPATNYKMHITKLRGLSDNQALLGYVETDSPNMV